MVPKGGSNPHEHVRLCPRLPRLACDGHRIGAFQADHRLAFEAGGHHHQPDSRYRPREDNAVACGISDVFRLRRHHGSHRRWIRVHR